MARTIKWKGRSGREYTYWIYPIGDSFASQPGNYIFAKETSRDRFRPLYIGETEDLTERFDDHHRMPCIRREGATHIHAHKNEAGQAARKAEEKDLIDAWQPPCNG